MQQKYLYYSGIAAATTVLFIWSGWLVLSRWGVTHTLSNLDILFLRFAVASIVILPFLTAYKKDEIIRLFNIKVLIAGFATGLPYIWLSFIGLEHSPTAHSGVLVNGSLPIFTALLMFLAVRAKPGKMQVLGALLIIMGNAVLLFGDGGGIGFGFGQLALLGAGLSLSIYTVTVKLWQIKPREIIIACPLSNFIVILPLWLWHDSRILQATLAESVWQGAYQGVLVSLVALWLMSHALKYITPYLFSAIMAMVPVCATLMAYLILREALTAVILSGAIFCVIGIICFNAIGLFQPLLDSLKKKRKSRPFI